MIRTTLLLGLVILSGAQCRSLSAQDASSAGENTASPAAGLSPSEALDHFQLADGLQVESVLAEPLVQQPVFMNFDERGRLWVSNYLQYPYPAGLKLLGRDKFYRTTFDKVPVAPPHHEPGADRISIHEDTDGDGKYDKHSTFVEGLSITTSFAHGRGGVWVLNPPYLLFYPDRDKDDVPDSDPVVHLSGFGLEDTHSCANSLRFGPDGWLYGCQGSTVSGRVLRHGIDIEPVTSMGQLIWRYHPENRVYEIFAEGGGNAFGLEFDSQGRAYSGHNGGNTRGFHYVQGGYFQKGFSKHGALSNPYAFGYFSWMGHVKVARFTHNFVIYEGASLPSPFHGQLFGIGPLQNHVVLAKLTPDGSTYQTTDVGHAIESDDERFRPVDIKAGPQGAVYVADFYEKYISHRQHHDGQIEKHNGRIYRIQSDSQEPSVPTDFGRLSTRELLARLGDENKWVRQTVVRILGDRLDRSAIPALQTMIRENDGQLAVDSLWGLNASGGFTEDFAIETLDHNNAFVRSWAVRLLSDDRNVSDKVAGQLVKLAVSESEVQVRSQLAASARRLPAKHGLPIVNALVAHAADTDDPHVPLMLWWAIEAKAESDSDAVLALFESDEFWNQAIVKDHLLERTMRRYARAGRRKDLIACATLLDRAPEKQHVVILMKGFEKAFQGRSLTGLPDELVATLARVGGGSETLRLRQKDPLVVQSAIAALNDSKVSEARRREFIDVFGELRLADSIDPLLQVVGTSKKPALVLAALTALQSFDRADIADRILESYGSFTGDNLATAQSTLASRPQWAGKWLQAMVAGRIDPKSVPLDMVWKLQLHKSEQVTNLTKALWGDARGATPVEMRQRIAALTEVITKDSGDPALGKKLFTATCAKCHRLFDSGGQIGPDLTSYKRDDLSRMVLNVANPSAEIREGYETWLIVTESGRTVTGFKVDEDERVIVLRGSDGNNINVSKDSIDESVRQPNSLMPQGLLKGMSDQEIRNLFAYLRSSQPLN